MIDRFQIKKFIEPLLIACALLCVSFLNYCLCQVVGTYFFPFTVLVIFFAAIFSYEIPISFILGISFLDDILASGFLGLYGFIYFSIIYLINTKLKELEFDKKTAILCGLGIFILTNLLSFRH